MTVAVTAAPLRSGGGASGMLTAAAGVARPRPGPRRANTELGEQVLCCPRSDRPPASQPGDPAIKDGVVEPARQHAHERQRSWSRARGSGSGIVTPARRPVVLGSVRSFQRSVRRPPEDFAGRQLGPCRRRAIALRQSSIPCIQIRQVRLPHRGRHRFDVARKLWRYSSGESLKAASGVTVEGKIDPLGDGCNSFHNVSVRIRIRRK